MGPPLSSIIPPNSRILTTVPDDVSEDVVKERFAPYGTIEDAWFIRNTRKGGTIMCYVKFSKSSEALLAIEEMNGRPFRDGAPVMKVILAADPKDGNVYKGKFGTDHLERIFLLIRTNDTEQTLRDEYEKFGKITDLVLIRNKFAYISYSRAYEAALALEDGLEKNVRFRPQIAEPVGARKRSRSPPSRRGRSRSPIRQKNGSGRSSIPSAHYSYRDDRYGGISEYDGLTTSGSRRMYGEFSPSIMPTRDNQHRLGLDSSHSAYAANATPTVASTLMNSAAVISNNPTRCTQLYLKIDCMLNKMQVFKLCNLVPNLAVVELHKDSPSLNKTIAYVRYENPDSASWAWQKFQDFEYPPGFPIRIRYADGGFPKEWLMDLDLKSDFGILPQTKSADFGLSDAGPSPMTSSQISQHMDSFNRPVEPSGGGRFSGGYPDLDRYNSSIRQPDGVSQDNNQLPLKQLSTDSLRLPSPKPLMPPGTRYVDRCFFTTMPSRYSNVELERIFSSFNDFIESYYLKDRNCGYVLYASENAVSQVIESLDGATIFGIRIRISRAEPEPGR